MSSTREFSSASWQKRLPPYSTLHNLYRSIKLPVVFMARYRYVMILMRANPLLGPLEGVSPENLDFLGPNGTCFACCHFRAHKSLNSQEVH
jgi:hypothetical protein